MKSHLWIVGGVAAILLLVVSFLIPATASATFHLYGVMINPFFRLFEFIFGMFNIPYNSPLNFLAFWIIPVIAVGVPFAIGALATIAAQQIVRTFKRSDVDPEV